MAATFEIVPLRASQVASVAALLTRAFWNDPQMRWLLPDEDDRARVLPWLLATSVRYALRAGEAWTTPTLSGLALWLPPGARQPGLIATVRTGALAAPVRLGWQRFVRFTTLTARADQLRKHLMPRPHWHLAGLGVDPDAQRQFIGSALLQPTLQKADASGAACYLETYTPANVAFYTRHGFAVLAEEELLEGAPRIWAMGRDARR
jgi:ribosomal protein S18 acetylase RimI-like enzyme